MPKYAAVDVVTTSGGVRRNIELLMAESFVRSNSKIHRLKANRRQQLHEKNIFLSRYFIYNEKVGTRLDNRKVFLSRSFKTFSLIFQAMTLDLTGCKNSTHEKLIHKSMQKKRKEKFPKKEKVFRA